jgi:lipocalin
MSIEMLEGVLTFKADAIMTTAMAAVLLLIGFYLKGKVKVLNTGWKDGKMKVAHGKARQPDPAVSPSHLEVSFFLFFYSDYNVLMLDTDYQYALVGSRSMSYLWILARKPYIDEDVKAAMLAEAEKLGYDISKFIWVDQSWNDGKSGDAV